MTWRDTVVWGRVRESARGGARKTLKGEDCCENGENKVHLVEASLYGIHERIGACLLCCGCSFPTRKWTRVRDRFLFGRTLLPTMIAKSAGKGRSSWIQAPSHQLLQGCSFRLDSSNFRNKNVCGSSRPCTARATSTQGEREREREDDTVQIQNIMGPISLQQSFVLHPSGELQMQA